MKKFKLISLVFPTLLMAAGTSSSVWAAPAVTNVAGNVQNGQQISINGSGFGAVGPVVRLFDSFEKGTLGGKIASSTGGSDVNNWSETGIARYSSDYALSGGKSMKVDFSTSGLVYDQAILRYPNVKDSILLLSWWQYMPTNRDVPGTNGSEGPNWKWFWIGDESDSWPMGSDYTSVCLTNSNCDSSIGFTANRNRAGDASTYNGDWFGSTFRKGTWMRITVVMKNATSGGYIWNQEVSANGHAIPFNLKNIKTANADDPWNVFFLPGYGRDDRNAVAYYDDVYVATGNGARARVEIGEAATYSSCKKLAIIPTDSWSNTQVKASLHSTAQFKANDKVYLFVVDADGNASPGFGPLTVGQSSGNVQPPEATPPAPAPAATAPSGLNISER